MMLMMINVVFLLGPLQNQIKHLGSPLERGGGGEGEGEGRGTSPIFKITVTSITNSITFTMTFNAHCKITLVFTTRSNNVTRWQEKEMIEVLRSRRRYSSVPTPEMSAVVLDIIV